MGGSERWSGPRVSLEESPQILGERLDRLFGFRSPGGPALALEVGCGDGRGSEIVWRSLARWFPDPGTRLYALDADLARSAAAHRRLGRDGAARVRILGGDLYHLPLADRQLDFFFAFNVFFWADRGRLLEEARRVLKPGGRMLVYDLLPTADERRPLISFGLSREELQPG